MRRSRLLALVSIVLGTAALPAGCGSNGTVDSAATTGRTTATSSATSTATSGGSGGKGGGSSTASGTGGKATSTTGATTGAGGATTSASGAGGSTSTSGSGAGGGSTTASGAGGAGGSSGATTTTTASGAGGAGGCQSAATCPLPPNPCFVPTCVAGMCGVGNAAAGAQCLGGVCDGNGLCVQCIGGADCASGVCKQNVCAAATCMDGVKNGAETAVDCGGGGCPPCPVGQGCAMNADCQSGLCQNGVCQAMPTCVDGVKNGMETGLDCGGPVCAKCPTGQGCAMNADCASGVCMGGVCAAATCLDGVKNGAETDVDCGGGACPGCVNGKLCALASDCLSTTCVGGVCAAPGPACLNAAPNPATGQRCPLFMPCAQFSDCGVFQGCQQWFCNNGGTCELNALSNCWTDVGGGCAANVVLTQQTLPPVDKDFLPPDGVTFRELASVTFTVQNNTVNDLYLDKIPLQLDVAGGGSSFDVSTVKMYQNSGGTEHGPGDILVCLTGNPFSFPASGTLGNGAEGGCAGSAFSKILKNGGTRRFVIEVAFAANKSFIAGRSYRLRIAGGAMLSFKVGFNGPAFGGTSCGIPAAGFVGAWVNAKNG